MYRFSTLNPCWGGALPWHCVPLSFWLPVSLLLLKHHLNFYFLLFTFVLLWASWELLSCFENKFQCPLLRLKPFFLNQVIYINFKIHLSPLKILPSYTIPFLCHRRTPHSFICSHYFTQLCIKCLLCALCCVLYYTQGYSMVRKMDTSRSTGFWFYAILKVFPLLRCLWILDIDIPFCTGLW